MYAYAAAAAFAFELIWPMQIWKQAEELERTQKAAEEARKRRTAMIDGVSPTSAMDSLGLASAMRGGKSSPVTGTAAQKFGNHRTKRLHRREKIEL
jgi:septal ring factor EnvC (AmiA/AmiB activator)